MDGDELGAVREGGLGLDFVDHLGHAFHDFAALYNGGAVAHEVADAAAIAAKYMATQPGTL